MNKTDYYRKKLYEIDSRAGVSEKKVWLADIEWAKDFSEIEPLLYEYQDIYKDESDPLFSIKNILGLLSRKFISPIRMNSYARIKNVPEKIDTGDNIWFDMTDYPNQTLCFYPTDILKSLSIGITPVKCIDLTGLPNLQSLKIQNVRTVHEFKTGSLKNLKFLMINRCPRVEDLSAFESAVNVVWVDLGVNKRLKDITTLKKYQKAMIVSIAQLDILDSPSTIETLQQMKSLKFLFTGRKTKKQEKLLREALPNCYIS